MDTKICKSCHKEKPVSEFYINSSNRKPSARCKQCLSEYQKAKPKPAPKWKNTNRYETMVIAELRKKGIYAASGKSSEYNYVDVVAWGCIRIEVKLGEPQSLKGNKSYNFRFSRAQVESGMRADIVVLVVNEMFYVFPANHPMFYKSNGQLKTTVSYTFNSGRDNKDLLMQQHKNNWQLIEDIRQSISQAFMDNQIVDTIKPVTFTPLPERTQPEFNQLTLL